MGLLDTLLGRSKPVRPNLDALFSLPSAAVTLQSSAGLILSGKAGVCWMPPAGQSPADVQHEIEQLLDIPDDPVGAGQATELGTTGSGDAPVATAGAAPVPATPLTSMPAPVGQPASVVSPVGGGAGGAGGGGTGGTSAAGKLTQAQDSYGYRWLLLDDTDVEDLVSRVHLVNSTLSDNGWGPQLLCSVFGIVPGEGADATARPFYLVYLFKRGTFYPFAPVGKNRRDNELELRIRALLGVDLPVEPDTSRWFPLWDLPIPLP